MNPREVGSRTQDNDELDNNRPCDSIFCAMKGRKKKERDARAAASEPSKKVNTIVP